MKLYANVPFIYINLFYFSILRIILLNLNINHTKFIFDLKME